MLFTDDDPILDFICSEQAERAIMWALDNMLVGDYLDLQIIMVDFDEVTDTPYYEIYLLPAMYVPVEEHEITEEDTPFYDEETDEYFFIEPLDEFQIGNKKSFMLTLEHIVENY